MLTLQQVQIQKLDPFAESLFPELAELLSKPEYELAVRVMAWNKNIDRFHNITDLVFVEMFPLPWRDRCFSYYKGKRPALVDYDDMSSDYIDWMDEFLCNCVRLAYDYTWHRYDTSWKGFATDCMYLFISDRDKAKKLTLAL